ncbi:GNAT family N-acetyltransferase [Flavobacterium cerinum]|uniref:N-acetyltransferase n=1 Tax=Flavobacterium cerinum TaxID=2502784 RepID=A0A444GLX9_9FLAO|nr:N-acetyltransferase [Flavobacterium cerinum]RWW91937.1 N-acetyltransferase [Flavobacterium cerinum]
MDVDKIVIRQATSYDIVFLSEILVAAAAASGINIPIDDLPDYPDAYQYVEGYYEGSDVGIVAETISGEPVGAAWVRMLLTDDHAVGHSTPELTMGVVPEYRRKGVGELLMKELYRATWGKNIPKISLGVHKENTSAIMLYRKQGWIEDGTFKEYIMMSRKTNV